MTSTSRESADYHRMSTDVSNKTSLTSINNNPSPSSSSSLVDHVSSSLMMRAASVPTAEQPPLTTAANYRRSDLSDYRGSIGSGSGFTTASGVSSSFRSPKLEPLGGGMSAKKAQKLHHSSASSTGKWRQKTTTDVSASTAGGGRSQPSDSVRNICHLIFCGYSH